MRPPETIYSGHLSADGRYAVEVLDGGGARLAAFRGPVAWGYHGAAPDALAFDLLADALGDRERTAALVVWFRWAHVAQWGDRWEITAGAVQAFAAAVERDPDRRTRVKGRRVFDPRAPHRADRVTVADRPVLVMPAAETVKGGDS